MMHEDTDAEEGSMFTDALSPIPPPPPLPKQHTISRTTPYEADEWDDDVKFRQRERRAKKSAGLQSKIYDEHKAHDVAYIRENPHDVTAFNKFKSIYENDINTEIAAVHERNPRLSPPIPIQHNSHPSGGRRRRKTTVTRRRKARRSRATRSKARRSRATRSKARRSKANRSTRRRT